MSLTLDKICEALECNLKIATCGCYTLPQIHLTPMDTNAEIGVISLGWDQETDTAWVVGVIYKWTDEMEAEAAAQNTDVFL